MKLGKAKLCLLLLAASVGTLRAGVNVNNGNFYVTFTDFIVFTSGIPVEFTRTYNSRSNFVAGKFGVGWSSELDSYVKFENKDIVYYENGGGNILRFAAKADGTWENSQLGLQKIKKVALNPKQSQYQLQSNVGKTYIFNSIGQLVKVSDGNKNFVQMNWVKGTISRVVDNFNNQINLEWADVGGFARLKRIKHADRKATYEYSKTGDLIKVISQDASKFDYAYDDEHNMTKIIYGNGSNKVMAYNKIRDWISSFKDIDGSTIKYDYFSDTLNPENKFGTAIVRKDVNGKEESGRFWYEFRKRKDGSRYAYRTVASYNNEATETLLTECCGTPVTITQWNVPAVIPNPGKNMSWTQPSGKRGVTKFEYFSDGNLKRKIFPNGTSLALNYDPKTKKDFEPERAGNKVEYSYDVRQNLASAKDYGEKVKMDFTYDVEGRITTVKESPLVGSAQNRSLFFKYNTEGLPVEVKERNYDGRTSLIKMTYFPNGQIKEVLNASGRNLASQAEITATQRIYGTFQRVLEVIQPTGVSLNAEGTI